MGRPTGNLSMKIVASEIFICAYGDASRRRRGERERERRRRDDETAGARLEALSRPERPALLAWQASLQNRPR